MLLNHPTTTLRHIFTVILGISLLLCGCGGGGDTGAAPSNGGGGTPPAAQLEVQLVAGAFGPNGVGRVDGATNMARFSWVTGIVCDHAGNTYIADCNNQIIRKLSAQGTVTTLAGGAGLTGHVDGSASTARFSLPWGIAIDGIGNLYVSEVGNNAIRKITPSGQVSTLAGGNPAGSQDGPGPAARFGRPTGLAVRDDGTLFVADETNHTIRKITTEGMVSTFTGMARVLGSEDGTGPNARFCWPNALAIGPSGALYVADSHAFTIRKISQEGWSPHWQEKLSLLAMWMGKAPPPSSGCWRDLPVMRPKRFSPPRTQGRYEGSPEVGGSLLTSASPTFMGIAMVLPLLPDSLTLGRSPCLIPGISWLEIKLVSVRSA